MINEHSMISYFISKPKAIFIVDSIGAFISSFCLFIISRFYNNYFGGDSSTLILLAILPNIFCIYSVCCYLFIKHRYKPFILIIAVANLLYCLLTFLLISYFFTTFTILGRSYFILEIMVIAFLVYIELNVALKCQNES